MSQAALAGLSERSYPRKRVASTSVLPPAAMSCPSRGLLSVQLPRFWQPVVSCRPLLARVRLHLVVDGMSARHAGVSLWVVGVIACRFRHRGMSYNP